MLSPYPHQKCTSSHPILQILVEQRQANAWNSAAVSKRSGTSVCRFHLLTFRSNDVTETVKGDFLHSRLRREALHNFGFLFCYFLPFYFFLSPARGDSFSLWGEQLRYFANAIIEGYLPN